MAGERGPRQQGTSFWLGTRGVKKASFVFRHLSSAFVQKHYEVIRRLGKGTFGHIDLVRDRRTGEERVCKVVSTAGMHPHVLGMMRKEVQVLSALDHPHVVKLCEFAEDEVQQEVVLILEYVPGGDCLQLLTTNQGVLPEALVARLIRQLLLSLSYCHSRGIAHRDVKPENMVLTRASSDQPDCKVIDFGLATAYKSAVREVAGTVSYIAPEVAINQGGYSTAADIWSVGVTAFELLAGVAPFGKPEEHGGDAAPVLEKLCAYRSLDDLKEVLAGAPGWSQTRSREASAFLSALLDPNPEARPTAAGAVDHPWLLRHRDPPTGLTVEMLHILEGYAAASSLTQSCLFAVASKGCWGKDEHAAAFFAADVDGDGKVSKQDLQEAVAIARTWWGPQVDVDAVFRAADPDRQGFLGFTDFVAICLHGRYGPLDDTLALLAFEALDHDRDGLIRVQDAQAVFRDLPRDLPLDRLVSAEEWRRCLLREAQPKPQGTLLALSHLDILGRLFRGCQLRQDCGLDEVETFEPNWMARDVTPMSRPVLKKGSPPASPPCTTRSTRSTLPGSSEASPALSLDVGLGAWTARNPASTAAAAAAMAAFAMAGSLDPMAQQAKFTPPPPLPVLLPLFSSATFH